MFCWNSNAVMTEPPGGSVTACLEPTAVEHVKTHNLREVEIVLIQ